MADTSKRKKSERHQPQPGPKTEKLPEKSQPAQEWGERIETGKMIARGGKSTGHVPGATEQKPAATPSEIVTPPAPPGESAPEAVQKTQAVADALVQLGEDAGPQQVAEAVKAQTGIDLDPDEVVAIRAALHERAETPPGPD
jgi:hypothetical protein